MLTLIVKLVAALKASRGLGNGDLFKSLILSLHNAVTLLAKDYGIELSQPVAQYKRGWGNKIQAIKELRDFVRGSVRHENDVVSGLQYHTVGLKEAKDFIESLERYMA